MRGWHIWKKRISAALACIVMFVTVYLMVLPAITLDLDTAQDDESIVMNEEPLDREEAGEDPGTAGTQDAPDPDPEGSLEDPADRAAPAEKEIEGAEEPRMQEEEEGKEDKKDPAYRPQTLTEEGEDCAVTVSFGEDAHLPEDVSLRVKEIEAGTEEYEEYKKRALNAVRKEEGEEALISYARFFDIAFVRGGDEIEPSAPVSVVIDYEKSPAGEAAEKDRSGSTGAPGSVTDADTINVVHFDDGKTDEPRLMDIETEVKDEFVESISFESDSFSVYGIIKAALEKTVLAKDGRNYRISVSYGPETGIPEGAALDVEEIAEGSLDYDAYVADTEAALGLKKGSAGYIRLFDIKIVDKDAPEVKYQPQKDTTVDVKIVLADKDEGQESASNTQVVHFSDESENGSVVEHIEVDGNTVNFKVDGFSAYAIVEGPNPEAMGWEKITSLEEFRGHAETGMIIGHPNGFYFRDEIYDVPNRPGRTGIVKTKPASRDHPHEDAVFYYFEAADGQDNQFYAYCLKDGGRLYIQRTSNSLNLTADENKKTLFTFSQNTDGTWAVTNGGYYWNMQGEDAGNGFAAYNKNDSGSKMVFWHYVTSESEPYHLDNKTYGLMNWSGSVSGRAMMASSKGENALDAKVLSVMTEKENDEDRLFVPADSDISKWTFHWIEEDRYYLTAVTDGSTCYLKIDSSGLHLVESMQDASQIQVVPGTGSHAGEICLRSGSDTLTYSGDAETGFGVNAAAGNEWLHLVEDSELTSDYFMVHSARKVSVSNVPNGERIIVYTRVWNDSDKRYEFYAVGSDGNLVRVYESGDSIQWTGEQLNTLLWDFTEYYQEGTKEPSYYYELYNEYSEKYIAPQMTGDQILQDSPIGINLNGRRNGQYYTSVLAWDDDRYAYAGLNVENGKIVSCPKPEVMDFYFAVMEDIPVDDTLHTVQTVDNAQYGITMRMVNFTNNKQQNRLLSGADNGGGTMLGTSPKVVKNLLSTDLDENGYPRAVRTGGSMQTLYAGADQVNHLFIQSTFKATGYFEYDSTQNFASLDTGSKDFTVYKELGSYDSGTSRPTLKHGQFFPYNNLEPGVFASVNGKNLYTATADPLPDTDPRKNEKLYLIKNEDPYFGMELEASFTQTLNGKDAWNHDIIYEFTGDDDFWLYVDGELVIDLGGTHSAVPGFVNFSTGAVTQRNASGQNETTTLYEIFVKNYMTRGLSREEADLKARTVFKQNDDGNWVFPEYTSHTMKIFYMERGAGASNLHMRFNLASVRPGHVLLGKELAGVDRTESVLAAFPYQIYYRTSEQGEDHLLTQDPHDNLNIKVYYEDTETPVSYKETLTIGGVTYRSVFLLRPGERADIAVPDNAISYRIVECGVNTDIYESAGVKEAECSNVSGDGYAPNRADYGIEYARTKDRPRVTYVNTVKQEALRTLTVTKKLFDETGENEISALDDPATFSFRLYLGTEFDDEPALANMHSYHVKDPDGYYCRWDFSLKKFVSAGSRDLDSIEDKESVTFHTSMNGMITRIPSGYSVEVSSLLAGTQYRAEERPSEIPDGYSFQRYEDGEGHMITPAERNNIPGVDDTIVFNADPSVIVRNLKGWGFRVNKVWSDQDYMSDREAVYFAVFTRGRGGSGHGSGDGDIALVEGSVRQLPYDAAPQTLYWYFDRLENGKDIDDYLIREVRLTGKGWQVEEDGSVTGINDHQVHPLHDDSRTDLSGRQKGETSESEFRYRVNYDQGTAEAGSNVRVDTVSNTRPGIEIKKTGWDGSTPLAGAVFELKDDRNNLIGTFTSDDTGFITTAFLRSNVDYTLTETKAPQGWYGLQTPMTIRLNNNIVEISGVDQSCYHLYQKGDAKVLTVKDRPYTFRAVKKDGDTDEPMEGVEFALHKQKKVGGTTTIDLNPMPGFESLVTDESGIIPGLDNALPSGTYELREKSTIEGYEMLSGHIRFTLSPTGAVTLDSPPEGAVLTEETSDDGTARYILSVLNFRRKNVSFKKVDVARPDDSHLKGAVFDLYGIRTVDGAEIRQTPALYTGLTSGEDGLLRDSAGNTVFGLSAGKYHLVETEAPEGYIIRNTPVVITVTGEDVVYDDGTGISGGGSGKSFDSGTETYTLKISNSSGVTLPSTGGRGEGLFLLSGIILAGIGVAGLMMKRRKRDSW